MKFKIILLAIGTTIAAFMMTSADHIDSPSVSGTSADITDFYAFQSPTNSSNMVFVLNSKGLLTPTSTAAAAFSENVLFEVNIDNNGDNVEDLIIQLIPRNGKMYAFGPFKPNGGNGTSSVGTPNKTVESTITSYGQNANITTKDGVSLFAGPRDDPFFFDLGAYTNILGGNASGFSNPGTDTFAGSNVMSIVIEVPKTRLGSASTINTWAIAKNKI